MLRTAKQACLQGMRAATAFNLVSRSSWRRSRLLILCYHGIAAYGQERWDGSLFISAELFVKRLQTLIDGGFRVLSLPEGLSRLAANTLPERSVVLTFDDGFYSFYQVAWPILKHYNLPATVYLTTYYCSYNRPVFDLIAAYILWRARPEIYPARKVANLGSELDLRTGAARARVLRRLKIWAAEQNLGASGKDELAGQLAEQLGIDYCELLQRRLLHLMNPDEIAELAAQGVDFELHTHRHRMPLDRDLLWEELRQNRRRIAEWTGGPPPNHLCFPSGLWHGSQLPWLQEWGIRSAATCQPGLVSRMTAPLLLPRVVDHSQMRQVEFEGWLAGVRGFDPRCLYRAWSSARMAPSMNAKELQISEPDPFEEKARFSDRI
jgi:peptidoglycan/xylan/chitin deacetylase (PgdA/CDA1 family)